MFGALQAANLSLLIRAFLLLCQCRRLAVSWQVPHENPGGWCCLVGKEQPKKNAGATEATHHYQNKIPCAFCTRLEAEKALKSLVKKAKHWNQ